MRNKLDPADERRGRRQHPRRAPRLCAKRRASPFEQAPEPKVIYEIGRGPGARQPGGGRGGLPPPGRSGRRRDGQGADAGGRPGGHRRRDCPRRRRCSCRRWSAELNSTYTRAERRAIPPAGRPRRSIWKTRRRLEKFLQGETRTITVPGSTAESPIRSVAAQRRRAVAAGHQRSRGHRRLCLCPAQTGFCR